MINNLTIGDTITITIIGCETTLSSCATIPPPIPGTITVSTTSNINEFRVLYTNWGQSTDMDLSKFSYRACYVYSRTSCVEICSDSTDLNGAGLLCNKGNKMSLGAYTEGKYTLNCEAAYKVGST